MRTETDGFYGEHEEILHAISCGEKVTVFACEEYDSACVILNKSKAREFARQIMEMCGEE